MAAKWRPNGGQMAAKWRLNDSQTRENQLTGRNKLYLFFEACLFTIDHFYSRLLFICERYFDQNRAKRRKTTLMILEYGPVENAYIDHWDCFHRRF